MRRLVVIGLIFLTLSVSGQEECPRNRKWWVIGGETAGVAVGSVLLYQLWFDDHNTGKFRFFNDNPEWLGMDKVGHFYSAYQLSYGGFGLMEWSCIERRKALWIGAGQGFGLLLILETMDGFSEGWGFSWGDVLANGLGTGLMVGQELAWGEQRIIPRFSFYQTEFPPMRPELLGSNFAERMMKDYNGQVYWLSIAPQRFWNPEKKWMNMFQLSLGYGAYGMLTGRASDAATTPGVPFVERYHQFFLSADIDWRYVPVKWKGWRITSRILNAFKLPFLSLVFDQRGTSFHLPFFQ